MPRGNRIGLVAVLGATFVAVVLPFARGRLVDDDFFYLNSLQRSGWWHDSTTWNIHSELFRPLLFVAFGAMHSVFGLSSFGYHAVTAAAVLGCVALAYPLGARLGLRGGAVVMSAVVGVHATWAVPAAWPSALNSPVAVCCALGALVLLLAGGWRRTAAAAAVFVVGLLTREAIVVLPAVAFVVLLATTGGSLVDRAWRALVMSLPLWIIDVAYTVLRVVVGLPSNGGPYRQQVSGHALTNVWHLLLFGADLWASPRLMLQLAAALGWAVLAAAAAILAVRGRPLALAGLVWVALGMLPVAFLALHGMEPYYFDMALPGLALAVGCVAEEVTSRLNVVAVAAVGGVALGILAAVSFRSGRMDTASLRADRIRTVELVAQVRRRYPHPPAGGHIVVRGTGPVDAFITRDGDLFRVLYRDPRLTVTLAR